MSEALRFHDIHRHFRGRGVLRGLSLDVRHGEVYALLGRNGEGKTTAIRILLGLLAPMRGESVILGVPSHALRPRDRERIGYLAEGQKCFDVMPMRVHELLEMENLTRATFDHAFAREAALRYELPLEQKVKELSRGQKAQLGLLLAIGGRPEVLVLDDPAMGLDAVMRRDFLNTLIEHLVESGTTVFLSSHNLADVERLADRVGILKYGRLIVDATVTDLRQRVQKRVVRPLEGASGGRRSLQDLPGVIRAAPRREGYELTLLDAQKENGAMLQRLRAAGFEPGEAVSPSLEELFCDLTERKEAGDYADLEKAVQEVSE